MIDSKSTESALNISLITDNDLCISCGACKHGCPFGEIVIRLNASKEIFEPVVVNPMTCLTCVDKPCLAVCPSYEEDFISLAGWDTPESPIGPYAAIFTTYSTTDEIRQRASSGGIIKELCRYYMEKDLCDGVITLRHKEGLEYEPDVYRSVDDVLHSPGSIYHNLNFEKAISLIKSEAGRYVLIATPCQLTSIQKWITLNPEMVRAEIVLTIGLICGWQFTRHSLRHFSKVAGVAFNELTDVTYRGGDAHGKLALHTQESVARFNRRTKFFADPHHTAFRTAFSRTYNSQRCLLCVEHLNYLADIAVGDAWLDAFRGDTVGTSIIVVRKPSVLPAVLDLKKEGRIHLQSATVQDVIDSQSADLALGISARQISQHILDGGRFAPRYNLPLPHPGAPPFKVLWKNYLYPRVFRFFTWRGLGYPLYRLRMLGMYLQLLTAVPGALLKRLRRAMKR